VAKAIKITIDGTVRTTLINWKTLKINKNLTSQVDTAEFKYEKFGDRTWTPEEAKEVIIEFDADGGAGFERIFGGYTTEIFSDNEKVGHRVYRIKCKDYNYLLDRRLASESYVSKTPKEIVDDLVAVYAFGEGITTTGVDTTPTVDRIDFRYVSVRQAIRKVADVTYKQWYIDENKKIKMFNKLDIPAPFGLTDSNGNMIDGSLDVVDDLTQLKNRIVVRGAEYDGSSQIDRFVGSGSTGAEKDIFVLGYKPKLNLATGFTLITTNSTGGSPTTGVLGIEGLADETAVTAVINQRDKTLRFTSGNAPLSTYLVTATYTPILPVIVAVEDTYSVLTYGYKEYKITDTNIASKQAAKDAGNAELNSYALPLTKGTFYTYIDGLDSGQLININSTFAGINADYIIYQVVITMFTPTSLFYIAKFTSEVNFGVMEFFQKLLLDPDQLIDSSGEGDIEKVEVRVEKLAIIESVASQVGGDTDTSDGVEMIEDTATAIDTPKTWVWGKYSPTGIADVKRPLFADVDSDWA